MNKMSFLLILFLMIGCKGKGEVEVIPDYDAIYLPPSKVDMPIEILGDEDYHLKEVEKIIGEHFTPKNAAYYFFRAKLYIDEHGELNKVQFSKEEPNSDFSDSDINPNINLLFPKLAEYLDDIKYTSAVLGDKKVKSQFVWEASFKTNSTGDTEFYLGSLKMSGLKNFEGINTKEYSEKVDEMPFPVGGMKALAKNVKYPLEAKKAGVEGRVFVKAFIDKNGNVIHAEIIKGAEGGLNEAAINAVKTTKFKPGMQKGKPVKVQISIPILFKLN